MRYLKAAKPTAVFNGGRAAKTPSRENSASLAPSGATATKGDAEYTKQTKQSRASLAPSGANATKGDAAERSEQIRLEKTTEG